MRPMWALLAIVLFSPPVERCTACHPVRPADAHRDVACVACHLGDARAIEAEAAHAGMEAEPGALRDPAPSPAEDYVRRLCAGCHLGARRDNRDDAIAARGSGCSACHLAEAVGHPTTPTFPDDGRCLGCHVVGRAGLCGLAGRGARARLRAASARRRKSAGL